MAKVKNELKGKQRVLDQVIGAGEEFELTDSQMKDPQIKHAFKLGILSVVKTSAKPASKTAAKPAEKSEG